MHFCVKVNKGCRTSIVEKGCSGKLRTSRSTERALAHFKSCHYYQEKLSQLIKEMRANIVYNDNLLGKCPYSPAHNRGGERDSALSRAHNSC